MDNFYEISASNDGFKMWKKEESTLVEETFVDYMGINVKVKRTTIDGVRYSWVDYNNVDLYEKLPLKIVLKAAMLDPGKEQDPFDLFELFLLIIEEIISTEESEKWLSASIDTIEKAMKRFLS